MKHRWVGFSSFPFCGEVAVSLVSSMLPGGIRSLQVAQKKTRTWFQSPEEIFNNGGTLV